MKVLNYFPGFVETDMLYDALEMSKNEKFKVELDDLIKNKKLVTPSQTVNYLVEVLKNQNYESGDYVDYMKKT